MTELDMQKMKYELWEYFNSVNIHALRIYGRSIGVARATAIESKDKLMQQTIGVLVGEIPPSTPSNRGTPVKNNFVDPEIDKTVKEIIEKYDSTTPKRKTLAQLFPDLVENADMEMLRFNSVDGEDLDSRLYRGQYHKINGVARILPMDCRNSNAVWLLPDEWISRCDLREGDTLTFYLKKGEKAFFVREILDVNGSMNFPLKREVFEQSEVTTPTKTIEFLQKGVTPTPLLKYLDWVMPVRKGQRACVLSKLKAGKTTALYTMLQALTQVSTAITPMALLIEQSPETVHLFRSAIHNENLIYTTYEDDIEKQVFTAEFILQRAKRMAESGYSVVLLVDSLNALARAFNQTDLSIGGKVLDGGMESKTLQYMKKFLGSARCLANGGSITIIGALSCETGDPADDLLVRELFSVSNYTLCLDDEMATKRLFPAIDGMRSNSSIVVQGEESDKIDCFLKTNYLSVRGNEGLLIGLKNTENQAQFLQFCRQEIGK